MEENSRDTVVMIVIIFLVLVIALVAIVFTIYQIAKQSGGFFPTAEQKTQIPFILTSPDSNPEPEPYVPNNNFGEYDFGIDEDSYYTKLDENDNSYDYAFAVSKIGEENKYEDVVIGEKDEGLVDEVIDKQEEFENIEFGDITQVQVPSIGVVSPIFQGINGDELLDQGWWLYPGSYTNESGEKILYCHRRYFGRLDPRTCWNMNKVIVGDDIILKNNQGEEFVYKVISTSIVYQDTTNLMRPSTKDYVKIVTCGTQNGAPGGNDWRVVVLAELVK